MEVKMVKEIKRVKPWQSFLYQEEKPMSKLENSG